MHKYQPGLDLKSFFFLILNKAFNRPELKISLPGTHVIWVEVEAVTVHCTSPILTILLAMFVSKPVPVIIIELLVSWQLNKKFSLNE